MAFSGIDSNGAPNDTWELGLAGALEQLATLRSASVGVDPGKSLVSKVDEITAAVQAGQTAVACGGLTGYVNEVNAQSGKKIPTLTATALIASARQIAAVLGC
jgi:hypothetical protein